MSQEDQEQYDDLRKFRPSARDREEAKKFLLDPRDSLEKYLKLIDNSRKAQRHEIEFVMNHLQHSNGIWYQIFWSDGSKRGSLKNTLIRKP
jgi:hypothetical protein